MKLPRSYILLSVSVAVGLAGCSQPRQTQMLTVGGALDAARRTNRIVIVEFWDLNGDCRAMDQQAFKHPLVLGDLEDFIRVRVYYPLQKELAGKMAVGGAPGFAALRPDGSVITSSTGKLDADGLRRFLIRARIFR